MLRKLVLLLAAAVGVSSAASNQCCASCLAQTDPKTTNLTYDPLVFSQCSAVLGSICCYGCDFSHGAPSYSSGVTFSSGGAAQTTVGTRVTLSFNGISRITYDLLAKNQVKSTFVGNLSTQVLPSSDGSFSLCARTPGTIALRGWGADSCRQVTVEYTITVAAGDGTATCDAGTVKPAGGGSDSSAKPNQPVMPQDDGGTSKPSGGKGDASDIENCSATRGSVKTKDDGTKFCECVGDWRNPPLCDAYSWTKTIVTILGAVAAVVRSLHVHLSLSLSLRWC
jgi:hypothetical protein